MVNNNLHISNNSQACPSIETLATQRDYIRIIPKEIWGVIFQHLRAKDLLALSWTSKTFRTLVNSELYSAQKLKSFFHEKVQADLKKYSYLQASRVAVPEQVLRGFESVAEKIDTLSFKEVHFKSSTTSPLLAIYGIFLSIVGNPFGYYCGRTLFDSSWTNGLNQIVSIFPNISKLKFDHLKIPEDALRTIKKLRNLRELYFNDVVIYDCLDDRYTIPDALSDERMNSLFAATAIERLALPPKMQCILNRNIVFPRPLKALFFNELLRDKKIFNAIYEDRQYILEETAILADSRFLNSISKMQQLEELSINIAQHIDLGPLASLQNLHRLGIFSYADISEQIINQIGHLKSLKSLSIATDGILGSCKGLQSLIHLNHLTIRCPRSDHKLFSQQIIEPLISLKTLTSLTLMKGIFSQHNLEVLSTITQIKSLTLSGMLEKLNDTTILNFSHLEEFAYATWFAHTTEEFNRFITMNPTLKRVSFAGEVSHSILLAIQGLSNLEELHLITSTALLSPDFDTIAQFNSVKKLYIEHKSILSYHVCSNNNLKKLAQMPHLQTLTLVNNDNDKNKIDEAINILENQGVLVLLIDS